jgi:glyoxylase-like metal-dependent hydrolase (beta-lactamase superfamily II)
VSQSIVRDGKTEPGVIYIALTPHGFLKAAAANKASVATSAAQGRTRHTVSLAIGRQTLTGTIDDRGLVERVETRVANGVLGDMLVEAVFSDYRDYGGVKFPARITQRQGGHAVLDLVVSDVQPNGAAALSVSSPVQPPAVPPATLGGADAEKIADGVWFLTGGAPLSVLVEFSDHVMVIEAPQGDRRSEATIAAVKTLLPSKPIRYVVNTHHHFDHAGGIRGFVAAGIPVITHEANKPYFERIFKNAFTLEPDRLARAPRPAIIETVGDKRVFADAAMTMELHHLRGFLHDDAMLVAYLPKQKLLVQADAFHPRPGAAPLPSPSPFTVSLIENIRRLKLNVERVVHVHGGADSLATVVKAAGG